MINKGEPIGIERVANGFIVRPGIVAGCVSVDALHVFRSVQELNEWVAEHFGSAPVVVQAAVQWEENCK